MRYVKYALEIRNTEEILRRYISKWSYKKIAGNIQRDNGWEYFAVNEKYESWEYGVTTNPKQEK